MGNVWADLRYGARLLLKSPGFTLVALLTLALGIGANTAIFSVLDAVLLRPLPFPEPQQLAMIWEDASFVSFPKNTPAPANYWDWKTRNHTFSDIAAMRTASVSLTDEGAPEFVLGMNATSNLLSILGVKPAMGRNFTAEEDRSAATLVVISHGLWQRRFGGDPSIIGRSIRMSGVPHTVIGIMPRGFHFPRRTTDFWRPTGFGPKEYANRGQHFLQVYGRLKPGVSLEQARTDIARVTAQIVKENPNNTSPHMGSVVVPLHEEFAGNTRLALLVLLGASIAVLLIGCANLANLLMARGSVRTREMALRMALGAGRSRLVLQLLTESLLLASLGGLLGLGLARVGLRLLEYMVPSAMVSFTEVGIDGRVLAFTMCASLLTGIVFGLAPAWQSVRMGLNEALKLGGRSDTAVQGQGMRHALVVIEVAMAVTLVAGAGLLIQTLLNLRRVDVGFRSEGLYTAVTALPNAKYQTLAQRMAFFDRVIENVLQIPGVQAAAYASNPPFTAIGNTNGYEVEGQPSADNTDALYRSGTPTYLQTLGVRVKQGRLLDARDTTDAPPAVVVNETFVRKHFPSGDAVGKRVRFGSRNPWMTIVGVVEDMKERGLEREMKPATYVAAAQQNDRPAYLVVRYAGDARNLAGPIREAVWSVDKEQPLFQQRTMEEIIEEELTSRRQNTRLLVVFAGLALVLACVGLYGVLSYAVAQRRREIGLRMALGASPREVVGMILRRGMGMTAAGLAAGVITTWAVGRALTTMLYGVSSSEPLTFGVTAAVLLVVALIACAVPARRASRLDPMTALRDE